MYSARTEGVLTIGCCVGAALFILLARRYGEEAWREADGPTVAMASAREEGDVDGDSVKK